MNNYSEYADDILIEAAMEEALYRIEQDELRRKHEWVCKDGRHIKIEDMSEEHRNNTVKMLERNDSEFAEIWLHIFREVMKNDE